MVLDQLGDPLICKVVVSAHNSKNYRFRLGNILLDKIPDPLLVARIDLSFVLDQAG